MLVWTLVLTAVVLGVLVVLHGLARVHQETDTLLAGYQCVLDEARQRFEREQELRRSMAAARRRLQQEDDQPCADQTVSTQVEPQER